jgi:pimeloyl-ACP methyl ester carboxylesterase
MLTTQHIIPTPDGFRLAARQCLDEAHHNPALRPVVLIPGYGMNTFILGWHPSGESMEAFLTRAGFEVWSVNLRYQSASKYEGRDCPEWGLKAASGVDLPAAFEFVTRHTRATAPGLDAVGCSLGATILYGYMALAHERGWNNPVASMIGIGGPLKWVNVHPLLKAAFASPELIGLLPFKGTRVLARTLLPYALKIPGLLNIYLHPEVSDTSRPELLTQVVEDPNRFLNREIAEWVKRGDLLLDGVNVTEALGAVTNPLLLVLANADGIVPADTALSARDAVASEVNDVITVGNDRLHFAHADLFISYLSQRLVFGPMADWLKARY